MQDFDTWSGQERRIFRLLTRPRSTCGGYCRVGKTEASERTRLATAVCLWKELSQPCSQSAQMQKMMQDQEAALDMLRTTSLGAISACAGAGKTTVLVNLIRGLGPEALVWLCPATKEEKAAFVESLLDGPLQAEEVLWLGYDATDRLEAGRPFHFPLSSPLVFFVAFINGSTWQWQPYHYCFDNNVSHAAPVTSTCVYGVRIVQ